MELRQLGNSDMQISPVGFGAWVTGGGGYVFGWGHQDDDESITAIHRALDVGVNWIDTAAVYGMGHSEEVVGKAIKGLSQKPYIFTKCSRVWDDEGNVTSDLSPANIRREVEDSLRRLDIEVIDLYQVHWPQPESDLLAAWETMAELQKAGKVRYIAVSNFSPAQMERCAAIAPITSNQPPYSLIRRDIEADVLPYCQEHNIGTIVYSPMQSGLLTGAMTRERIAAFPEDDHRRAKAWFQEPALTRNLKLADLLKEIGAAHGHSAAAVAVAWTLNHPAVTGAIVGARRPSQVDGFAPALEWRLSGEELARIEAFLAQAD